MASLADELLAELEPEGAAPLQEGAVESEEMVQEPINVGGDDAQAEEALEMDQDALDAVDVDAEHVASARTLSRILGNPASDELLASIKHYMALPLPPVAGALESSPEYALIVRANNTAVEVDNELLVVHKFIRERFAPRFPELETLVHSPWDFVKVVEALGNDTDLTKGLLDGIIPHGTVVVISMTASTTAGRPLAHDEWERVADACKMVHELDAVRRSVLEYVESRMTLLAPNMSALVGTRVATKLLGAAGGLTALAKIPACNLHLLGAARKHSGGLSTIHGASTRYSGFLAQARLVADTPEDYRTQALRMIAGKATLAARMDASGGASARSGDYGRALYAEVEKKIEKLLEPPPAKLIKALPVPTEGGRKQRRGGRRARKFRELYGQTELGKMANRVEFGKAEEEASAFDETMGLGMVNTKASGRIRAVTADAKSKARMSKANKERLATLNRPLSLPSVPSSSTSGIQSSLSFTPVQGIELVDPSRQRKVAEANAKWFSEGQFSLVPGVGSGSKIPGLGGGMPPPPPPTGHAPASAPASRLPGSSSRRT
ncbi:U4/U6-U5 snRNP complex subunit prp31 [Malassezia cuniculi]|uniref:U4/U6-U5 snRNP complex subunit prp31 n=1 Tax=Malassezia cuniculi TaxID=948313 RepID=A0AAF0EQU0_9BASI|nr:U4/U6-U5 snRNP complex subunit prp31 [Malassezia cuniculi]